MSKVCSTCGKELENNTKFCGECGGEAKELDQKNSCKNCGYEIKDGGDFCEKCGYRQEIQQEGEGKFCEACGAEIESEDVFCKECGYSNSKSTYANGQSIGSYENHSLEMSTIDNARARKKKNSKEKGNIGLFKGMFFMLTVAIVVVIIVIVFFYLRDNNTEDTIATQKVEEIEVKEAVEEEIEEEIEKAEMDEEHGVESAESEALSNEPTEKVEKAAKVSVESSITATVVDASQTNSNMRKINVSSAYATSTIVQPHNDNSPEKMLDNDLTSSWQEGVEGNGIGESVEFYLDGEQSIKYIEIYAGNYYNDEFHWGNNRISNMTLEIGEGSWQIPLPDIKEPCIIELSQPCIASKVKIQIDGVHEGTTYEDTCIAEVTLYEG